MKPSIDAASKITDALCVASDYLGKDNLHQRIDNNAMKRLKSIEKLQKDERPHLFATINAFFAKNVLQALLQ